MDRTDKLIIKPHNKGHRTAGYTWNAVRQRHTKASNCFFNHEYPPKIFVFPITSFPEYLNYWLLSTAGSSAQIFFTQSLRSFPKHNKILYHQHTGTDCSLLRHCFLGKQLFHQLCLGCRCIFLKNIDSVDFCTAVRKGREQKAPLRFTGLVFALQRTDRAH